MFSTVYFSGVVLGVEVSLVNSSCVEMWQGISSVYFLGGGLSSVLPERGGVLAVLHAVEVDVDDGHQAPGGAQGAEQPVRIGLAQDLQDVTLVEAQLTGLGGYVVAQSSDSTEEQQGNN